MAPVPAQHLFLGLPIFRFTGGLYCSAIEVFRYSLFVHPNYVFIPIIFIPDCTPVCVAETHPITSLCEPYSTVRTETRMILAFIGHRCTRTTQNIQVQDISAQVLIFVYFILKFIYAYNSFLIWSFWISPSLVNTFTLLKI